MFIAPNDVLSSDDQINKDRCAAIIEHHKTQLCALENYLQTHSLYAEKVEALRKKSNKFFIW